MDDPVTFACPCYDVSGKAFRDLIARGETDPAKIQEITGAGLGCGMCEERIRLVIQEAVSAAREETAPASGPCALPEKPFYPAPTITLTREPVGGTREEPRPKTVTQLCNRLGIAQGTALIIRNGELLTPDRRIEPGDHITVRSVVSRG